mmetsp:Transcript_2530/g.3933  ORF Transcript_2530/g.3933 Transcript_2530/m.3933 type:complete len:348 (-) Transcript_2530:268-1311(-)
MMTKGAFHKVLIVLHQYDFNIILKIIAIGGAGFGVNHHALSIFLESYQLVDCFHFRESDDAYFGNAMSKSGVPILMCESLYADHDQQAFQTKNLITVHRVKDTNTANKVVNLVMNKMNDSLNTIIISETFIKTDSKETPVFNITNWSGRTGNNYIQMKNAIKWAVCCKGIVVTPSPHSILKAVPKVMNFTMFNDFHPNPFNHTICSTGHTGIFWDEIERPNCNFNTSKVVNFLIFGNKNPPGVPMDNFPCERFCSDELRENILTIFFRSGDIFKGNQPPFIFYRQPPLYFYEQVIQSRKWSLIIFVTANSAYMNPVWKHYFETQSSLKHFSNPNLQFMTLSLSYSMR